jgi:hypothetical protein
LVTPGLLEVAGGIPRPSVLSPRREGFEKSKYALKAASHWALRIVLCTSVTIDYERG